MFLIILQWNGMMTPLYGTKRASPQLAANSKPIATGQVTGKVSLNNYLSIYLSIYVDTGHPLETMQKVNSSTRKKANVRIQRRVCQI